MSFGPERWGFCPRCELWQYTQEWTSEHREPSCPICTNPNVLVERSDGSRLRLRLDLEVAVGPVGNRQFL